MKIDEKKLIYFLNYTASKTEIFIRSNAILWVKNRFVNYWKAIDEKENSNYTQVIKEIYIDKANKSLQEISTNIGLHVRTLNRYREKFVNKFKSLIAEYQTLSQL